MKGVVRGADLPIGGDTVTSFVLLASDEASYISGATIAVTGGKSVL